MPRDYNPEDAAAARQEKLDELQARIESAVEDLVTGDDWIKAIAFAAKFRSRSFLNTMAIWVQHQDAYEKGLVPSPEPTYVAGFKQWQSLGRFVQKGQPGYAILAPVTATFVSDNPASGEWRRLERGEAPKPGEVLSRRLVGVKPAYVWDASQTGGDGAVPIRPTPTLLEGEAPAGLWDGIAARLSALGYALEDVANAAEINGANGQTNYATKLVSVRLDMDDAARVKTLAHELGHVLLTAPDNPDASRHRGISEVEAESFAAMMCACYGMDSTGYTVPYVAGWAETVKDKTPLAVMRDTGERVRYTVLAELDHLPTPGIDDGTPPGLEERKPVSIAPTARRDSAALESVGL